MSAHKVFACRVIISGALIFGALWQLSAAQQQPRPTVPAQPQPAAAAPPYRPATAPNGQQPAAPRGQAPNYSGAPQPAAPPNTYAQPPRAAAPQPRAAVGPQPAAAPAAVPNRQPVQAPAAGAVRQVQHQQPILPPLTAEQEAELDRVLLAWERESDKIKTLSANFTVWDYGEPFGKSPSSVGPPKVTREAKGEIHFAAPDKGSFRELEGGDERWMCDGAAIYEFKASEKVLKEYRLPPELQGKAISKGPLPFVFGAKADTMKQRYAMRIVTPADARGQIWIEAWPRTQQDAANFNHVQVILDTRTMLPMAVRMYNIDHTPAAQHFKVYAFANTKINGAWDQIKSFFVKPTTPPLWKRVVENAPSSPPVAGAPSVQIKPGATVPSRAAATADKRSQPAQAPARPQ